jgi:hypothetical protein
MDVAPGPSDEAAPALEGPRAASQPKRPKAKQKTQEQKAILERVFVGVSTFSPLFPAYSW